jgi:peptidoglycan hydrolase-like protein with peptidoglycan-binding domain
MWNIFDAVRATILVGFISFILLSGCARNNPNTTNDGASLPTPVDGQSSEDINVQNGGDSTMGSINSGTTTPDVIRQVQTQLSRKGYAVGINGVLEPKTVDAVRSFQRDNNLQTTGQLDKATLNALQVQTRAEDTRAPASVQEPIN